MAKNLLDKRLATDSVKDESSILKVKLPKAKKKNLLSSRLDDSSSVIISENNNKGDKENVPFNNEEKYSKVPIMSKIKMEGLFNKKKISKSVNARNTIDDILDTEFENDEKLQIIKYRSEKNLSLLKKICIITCSVYVVLLIFGAYITQYTYDENGNAIAMAMGYYDLKALDEFNLLVDQYYEMQDLYDKTLKLDMQFLSNPESITALSANYEELLDDVSKLSIKTESISLSTKYSQIRSMMLAWIKTDIAVYLQNMSAAIAQNNAEKANNAAQYRARVHTNYKVITNNLIALGKEIKGMNVNNLVEWTPDKYITSSDGEGGIK